MGADRVAQLLRCHAAYAWDGAAEALVRLAPIAGHLRGEAPPESGGLCIAEGVVFDPDRAPRRVDCFGTEMVILHPLDPGDFPGFAPVPEWEWLWRSDTGALMPAFNLAGFVERYLDGGEERAVRARDEHGRLPLTASTLHRAGVAHRPLLNQYFFALLATLKGLAGGLPAIDPTAHVLPPVLVLSHDCDQLRGNDAYTQLARLARFAKPLARGRLPAFANLRHITSNALRPRRWFFDDALAMERLERRFGFRSAFYFLNGKGGRLGARSGSPIIAEFVRALPADVEVGIHYNYGYAHDGAKLSDQIEELEHLGGRPIRAGRAHYLRFRPESDFATLARAGIRVDESLGFSQANGYRSGFAGAYPVAEHDVVEIPLQFMDTNTAPRGTGSDLLSMVRETEAVGGVVTLLFHPGSFDTPEAKELEGLYPLFLRHFADRGYRSMLPSQLGELVRARCLTGTAERPINAGLARLRA